MDIYYTFPNTHAVILAEKILLSAGFSVKVRPVPTIISAGCGLCLCIAQDFCKQAEAEMKNHSVLFSAVYLFKDTNFILLGAES